MQQNPNWIRTIFVSFLIAWFTWWKFDFPFWTTFIALVLIYAVIILFREDEFKTMLAAFSGWLKTTWKFFVSFGIFLVLQFIAMYALGIHQGDVWSKMHDSGGFYWIFWGHGVSTLFLAGLLLDIVLAVLATSWTTKKGMILIGFVIITAAVVVVIAAAFPEYADTWYTRQDLSKALARKSITARLAGAMPATTSANATPQAPAQPDYPLCADVEDMPFASEAGLKSITVEMHPECKSGMITTPLAWENVLAQWDKGGVELWFLDGYHIWVPPNKNEWWPRRRWVFRVRGEGKLTLFPGE